MANPSVVPPTLNVELDYQLQQEVNFFLNWGYLIVDNAATPDQIESLRNALDESYERNDKSQFIGELLEEDDRFAFLLDNPPVLKRMEAILGTCVQLHSATARITEPGTPDQNWHRDGPWPIAPHGTPYGSLPAQINCGYYLDEITDDTGPTVIQPGSHRAPFPSAAKSCRTSRRKTGPCLPRASGHVRWLDMAPRCRQYLLTTPTRLSHVLSKRMDEVS